MQVTRPNEIRSPAVRLHPKACAALGLEAQRATPVLFFFLCRARQKNVLSGR